MYNGKTSAEFAARIFKTKIPLNYVLYDIKRLQQVRRKCDLYVSLYMLNVKEDNRTARKQNSHLTMCQMLCQNIYVDYITLNFKKFYMS